VASAAPFATARCSYVASTDDAIAIPLALEHSCAMHRVFKWPRSNVIRRFRGIIGRRHPCLRACQNGDVHDRRGCARGCLFSKINAATSVTRSRSHWSTEEVFRRVVSGFASVTSNARRSGWNINSIKNARMEAAFGEASHTCGQ